MEFIILIFSKKSIRNNYKPICGSCDIYSSTDTDIYAGSYDKTDFVPEISPNVDRGTFNIDIDIEFRALGKQLTSIGLGYAV